MFGPKGDENDFKEYLEFLNEDGSVIDTSKQSLDKANPAGEE
jgi:hypothetical protein